jgi:hypothetical protein
MKSSTSILRTFSFLAFFMGCFNLIAEPAQSVSDRLVYIKGEGLGARDVLNQVEEQAGLRLILKVDDQKNHKKDYDDLVTVDQVIDALRSYYKKHMGVDLKLRAFGRRRYVIYSDDQPMPQAKSVVSTSSDVESMKRNAGLNLHMPLVDLDGAVALAGFTPATDELPVDDKTVAESSSEAPMVAESQSMDVVGVDELDAPASLATPSGLLLDVEVIGKKAVKSNESKETRDPNVISVEPTYDLSALEDAEELYSLPSEYESWKSRLDRYLASGNTFPFGRSFLRSPMMVGMMRQRDIFSGGQTPTLSLGVEALSMSENQLESEVYGMVLSATHTFDDGYRLEADLAYHIEDVLFASAGQNYRSSVHGLSALDFSVSKMVKQTEDVDLRASLQGKLPMATGDGLMGGVGMDFGISVGAQMELPEGVLTGQVDVTHFGGHDKLGSVSGVVPSIQLSWSDEWEDVMTWSVGGTWNAAVFDSAVHGALEDDLMTVFLGSHFGEMDLPLSAHLYMGLSNASADVGFSISWTTGVESLFK